MSEPCKNTDLKRTVLNKYINPMVTSNIYDKLYTVEWQPSIEGFFHFVREYRRITGIHLGGTRKGKYEYTDPTSDKVLSVSHDDDKSCFPQRLSLLNFFADIPITSYGCIYRYWNAELGQSEYLIAQRANSVNYTDFLQGNYRDSQLFLLLRDLPHDERHKLLSYDFATLWYDLCLKSAESEIYTFALENFTKIRPYLEKLFEILPSDDPTGKFRWIFPKGRPIYFSKELVADNGVPYNAFIPESPYDCAIREFKEETNGIDVLQGSLLLEHPIVERYMGTNSKNYRTVYFVFGTTEKPPLTQFPSEFTGIRQVSGEEISHLSWVSLADLPQFLRPGHLDLITYIENHLPRTPEPLTLHPFWSNPSDNTEPTSYSI